MNIKKLWKLVLFLNNRNVSSSTLNFHDYNKIIKIARNFAILVGLVPGKLGYKTIKAALEAGVDMVDLSYMPEDPLTLNLQAWNTEITVIPDRGIAPGLSNILVGRALDMLNQVKNVIVLIGGLPQKRIASYENKVTMKRIREIGLKLRVSLTLNLVFS